MSRRLRSFQREDIDAIKRAGVKALVASAPGSGKTAIAIRSLVETYTKSFPALIVCPATVTRNWANEWKMWGNGFNTYLIEDSSTPIPTTLDPRNTVFIMSWALLDVRLTDILELGIKAVVADEAHYSRNRDTLRAQALYRITRNVQGILLLSGTPIVNNLDELSALNELLGTDKPLMLRRLLEDVAPDIPEKKRSYVYIRLRAKHREVYDRALHDFEEWLRTEAQALQEDGLTEEDIERTLAVEGLAKVGYLRRLVGEYKVPAAADWIARAIRVGEPVVVFLEHQHVLKKLSRALHKQRIRHGVIDGTTSPVQRQELVEQFQRGEFPVFIGTRAAKEGITLTTARHLLFVERFFTSADEEQAEDRVRRIGQTQKTTIWYLHADATIDDRLDAIVGTKRALIRTAIGSATTPETPTSAVESILKTWAEFTLPAKEQVYDLGLGEPLEALPGPPHTHGIVFNQDRWRPETALRWCKMNGYVSLPKPVFLDGRFKLIVHPANVFKEGQFVVTHVSKDIKIISGVRLGKAAERQIRRSMRLRA